MKPEVDPNYHAPDDITDRMILPMLNESVSCLHDGVVDDADLLDAGVIFGTGFAPFRGGPIQYIRSEGADKSKPQLDALSAQIRQTLHRKSRLGQPRTPLLNQHTAIPQTAHRKCAVRRR